MRTAKIVILGLCTLAVLCYSVYSSDWFQKKFLYPFPYQDIVFHYAAQNELDPFLVAGVIHTESKFKATARSPKGAMGIMQMMPQTADWVAGQVDYNNFVLEDLNNPEVSIQFGTWYLASVKREFGNNEILALAAYNGGRGNVRQWMRQYGWPADFADSRQIPFRETREYVSRVLADKQRYQDLYGR